MSRPFTLNFYLCVFLLLTGVAGAQTTPTQSQLPADAELADIRFEGVSNPNLESLLRVRLVSRAGVPVSEIDLTARTQPRSQSRYLFAGELVD